ncbi:hypothetical protein FVE85_6645 [Porphyridium purpureum]|uniref:Uncharacterized protein n=1 Tax=Porphyridium purpureum TaxID=35688 RepID=A0A5J4Z7C0_PORPP|nr:hypothetical protein FVE85_6645 [Porphyridium purpureum]|eukprot:POR3936..scf295_1
MMLAFIGAVTAGGPASAVSALPACAQTRGMLPVGREMTRRVHTRANALVVRAQDDPSDPSSMDFSTESAMVVPSELVGVYQLDELEDKDTCVTAIYLCEGGEVKFGETDGPEPARVSGSWMLQEGNKFAMNIQRVFEDRTGEYTVTRDYIGSVTRHLSYMEIDGTIQMQFPVGYFKLFNAKDDLPAEDMVQFKSAPY